MYFSALRSLIAAAAAVLIPYGQSGAGLFMYAFRSLCAGRYLPLVMCLVFGLILTLCRVRSFWGTLSFAGRRGPFWFPFLKRFFSTCYVVFSHFSTGLDFPSVAFPALLLQGVGLSFHLGFGSQYASLVCVFDWLHRQGCIGVVGFCFFEA